jgi:SAM-dependent methyltransferase
MMGSGLSFMAAEHAEQQLSIILATDATEPLRDLAAEAYELSDQLCDTCRDLHALWSYIRLSRASTGVEGRESRLHAELRALFGHGFRHVLIAGSQDAGLLALVVHAGVEHAVEITVLDICETPLELCRRLAKQWSLSIETIRQDLLGLNLERRFDVVLVHGTLHFIAADRRIEALTRIRRAIRPGGRLMLLFNTSRPVMTKIIQEPRADYGSLVLAELKRLDVPLPDAEAVMRERLNAHQSRRELREGAFVEPQDVELLLIAAGFSLNSCTRVDVNVASPMDPFIARVSKRRFMAVAEPKSGA